MQSDGNLKTSARQGWKRYLRSGGRGGSSEPAVSSPPAVPLPSGSEKPSRRSRPSAAKSARVIVGMVLAFVAIVAGSKWYDRIQEEMLFPRTDVVKHRLDRAEFIELCRSADPATIRELLADNPEFAEPVANSRPLLHELILRADVSPEVLGVVLESPLVRQVDMRDMLGDTALHVAVHNGADPAVLLLLRAAGADPTLVDAGGKTPLERLVAGDRERFAEADAEVVSIYGGLPYTLIRRPASSADQPVLVGAQSVTGLVDDPELRLYFSLLCKARAALAETRLSQAVIDDVEMPLGLLLSGKKTAEGDLWRRVSLEPGTAGVAARIKCLLPEALPESISWFSATVAGKTVRMPVAAEWGAWSAPAILQTAGVLLSSGGAERSPGMQDGIRSLVRNELSRYAPSLRNTPLLVYSMLTVAPPAGLKATLKEARDGKRNDEAVLYEIWSKLSSEGRKRVGPHLVAALAYRRVVGSRLALLPPIRFFGDAADMELLRLWGAAEWPERPATGRNEIVQNIPVGDIAYLEAETRHLRGASAPKDPGAPLVAAASVCMELPEKDALKMFDLLIEAGNRPNVPDQNGRLPVDVAREAKASRAILTLLAP